MPYIDCMKNLNLDPKELLNAGTKATGLTPQIFQLTAFLTTTNSFDLADVLDAKQSKAAAKFAGVKEADLVKIVKGMSKANIAALKKLGFTNSSAEPSPEI